MVIVYFITHPEVSIDAAVPVPDWPLSPVGSRRMQAAMGRPWLAGVRSVFCSAERKAMDAAGIAANYLGLRPTVVEALGENDRSATGYLPKSEFEAVADEFFARPDDSIRGWERAKDAQHRIVGAVERIVWMSAADGDVAIVSHGGVGTLFLCHLKGIPISRTEEQPGEGGGNFFSFDAAGRHLLSEWRRIEA
jgi:broad specificity phosphatase PhoE